MTVFGVEEKLAAMVKIASLGRTPAFQEPQPAGTAK